MDEMSDEEVEAKLAQLKYEARVVMSKNEKVYAPDVTGTSIFHHKITHQVSSRPARWMD